MELDIYHKYEPSNKKIPGVDYVRNSKGDWYENQKNYQKNTLKIMVNEKSHIVAYSIDSSSLNPNGFAVIEVDINDVPESLNNNGEWMVNNEFQIVEIPISSDKLVNEALEKKLSMLKKASEEISKINDAQELNMSLPGDDIRLKEWKKFRVLVDRVDTKKPKWPSEPKL